MSSRNVSTNGNVNGEKYYSTDVAEHLEELVDATKVIMQEISVIDYAVAA